MAEKAPQKKEKVKKEAKARVFKLEGDKAVRMNKACPKCGQGVFMGKHKDRVSCGKCGYTEWMKGGQ